MSKYKNFTEFLSEHNKFRPGISCCLSKKIGFSIDKISYGYNIRFFHLDIDLMRNRNAFRIKSGNNKSLFHDVYKSILMENDFSELFKLHLKYNYSKNINGEWEKIGERKSYKQHPLRNKLIPREPFRGDTVAPPLLGCGLPSWFAYIKHEYYLGLFFDVEWFKVVKYEFVKYQKRVDSMDSDPGFKNGKKYTGTLLEEICTWNHLDLETYVKNGLNLSAFPW